MLKCNNVIHQRVRAELSRQTVFGEFKAKNSTPAQGTPLRSVLLVFYILSLF